jgi:hypothetical protein
MYINNPRLATIFRLLLVGICLYGLIAIFSTGGVLNRDMWAYYTNDSNIVVLVFFSWLLIHTWRRPRQELPSWYPTAKGAVIFCIMLTCLIYHFVLSPTLFSMAAGRDFALSPMNIVLHYIVPLMALADWLLFDKKGSFQKWSPLAWLSIPAAYFIFSLIRAQFATFSTGSHYPYFFIDVDAYGAGQVALNVLAIAVVFTILGYVLYFADLMLAKIAARSSKQVEIQK